MLDGNFLYLRRDCYKGNGNCRICVYAKSGRRFNENGGVESDFRNKGVCRDMLDAFGYNLPIYDD